MKIIVSLFCLAVVGLTILVAYPGLAANRSVALASEVQIDSPSFTARGELRFPNDYREWVFLTSGIGMTYGPSKPAQGDSPRFDNVFVRREAYQSFLRTGTWPDQTMLILEVRDAHENISINKGGRTQGKVRALEAAVKDKTRFPPSGWAYFSFDHENGLKDEAAPLPATASCMTCHEAKGAVDNTFVQFYPTLLEAAKRHQTLRPEAVDSR